MRKLKLSVAVAGPIAVAGFLLFNSGGWSQSGVDVDVVLKSPVTMSGQVLSFPSSEGSEVEGHMVSIEPGAEVGRHKHPYPVFMYILEGVLVVEHDDGTQKTYQAGDALVEDANVWLNNKNPSDGPTKFLAVLFTETNRPGVIFPE